MFTGIVKRSRYVVISPQQILLSGSVNVFPWSEVIFFSDHRHSFGCFFTKRHAKSMFFRRAVTFDFEKRNWDCVLEHKAWRFSFCSLFTPNGSSFHLFNINSHLTLQYQLVGPTFTWIIGSNVMYTTVGGRFICSMLIPFSHLFCNRKTRGGSTTNWDHGCFFSWLLRSQPLFFQNTRQEPARIA